MAWPTDAALIHGGARRGKRLPEYGVWAKMRSRCQNPRSADYKNYGARGITVCERWEDFSNFIADMGRRPTDAHTIERVDNDLGYSPDNCVWATREAQGANRRPRKKKSECQRGHPFTGDNVYYRSNGKRGCRACRRLNMRAYYDRQKEAQA